MRLKHCVARGVRMMTCAFAMSFASVVAAAPLVQSLDVRVPWTPAAVLSDGKTLLVYEIHLTSFSSADLALRRVAIMDANTGEVVDVLDGDRLRHVRRGLATPAQPDDGTLRPGGSSVVYIGTALGEEKSIPARLQHELEYDVGNTRVVTRAAPVEVSDREPVILGPPLSGGPWLAAYDPMLDRGHRRVFYAVEGAARVPGRFAIDWFKLDARGRTHRGERGDAGSWSGYGEPVLAVADATVASVRDGVPEGTARSSGAGRDLSEDSGNFVGLNLGDGRYVFYEHLKPGSIRVKQGERVRRGQILAALGNTGATSGPHLHLHVADANSMLAAEGLPFVLERFTLLGRYDSIAAAFKGEPWRSSGGAAPIVEREMPGPNVVVSFTEPAQRR